MKSAMRAVVLLLVAAELSALCLWIALRDAAERPAREVDEVAPEEDIAPDCVEALSRINVSKRWRGAA